MLWNSFRSSSRMKWVPYVFIEDYEGASSRLGPEAVLLMSILLVRYMPKRRRQSSKEVPLAAAVLRHIHCRILTSLQTWKLFLVVTPASFIDQWSLGQLGQAGQPRAHPQSCKTFNATFSVSCRTAFCELVQA